MAAYPYKPQFLSYKLDQIPTSCDHEKVLLSNFAGKQRFLCTRKVLIVDLKAEKHLQNENHTEVWELDCRPGDNGHVTH